ncbi:hypothetical protein D3C73_1487560 [compost metagenome]
MNLILFTFGCCGEQFLGMAGAIYIGGVEEVDSPLHRQLKPPQPVFIPAHAPVAANGPCAEADLAYG